MKICFRELWSSEEVLFLKQRAQIICSKKSNHNFSEITMENFKELEEKLSSKLSVIALESSSLQEEKVKPYLKVDAGNVVLILSLRNGYQLIQTTGAVVQGS